MLAVTNTIFEFETFSEKVLRKSIQKKVKSKADFESVKTPCIESLDKTEFIVEKVELIKSKKQMKKANEEFKKKKMQKIRLFIIPLYGYVCMRCGIVPTSIKDLHVDHIKPKSKYPELWFDLFNLQLLCKRCNFEKSNKNEMDYRKRVVSHISH